MLRKFYFLIIVCVAFQQINASASYSGSISVCNNEIVGTFQTPTIHESFHQVTDVYWEEDEVERYNWEKKSVKFKSDFNVSLLSAINSKELLYSHTYFLFGINSIPIYIRNGNLRI